MKKRLSCDIFAKSNKYETEDSIVGGSTDGGDPFTVMESSLSCSSLTRNHWPN